ncbi:hypothetical protein LINGRAHAP2_LOCUS16452 [Linum grandiflorum]
MQRECGGAAELHGSRLARAGHCPQRLGGGRGNSSSDDVVRGTIG